VQVIMRKEADDGETAGASGAEGGPRPANLRFPKIRSNLRTPHSGLRQLKVSAGSDPPSDLAVLSLR
jgi:hypothetical protein